MWLWGMGGLCELGGKFSGERVGFENCFFLSFLLLLDSLACPSSFLKKNHAMMCVFLHYIEFEVLEGFS